MSIVLEHQLEASEKSAGQLQLESQLQSDHRRAMFCYDVQDLMKSVISIFSSINHDVERWQHDITTGAPELRNEIIHFGENWEGLYRRLQGTFEKVSALIQTLDGFNLEGKREFLAAWKELRAITCFSREQISASVDEIKQGKSRSLGDIASELLGITVHGN